MWALRKGAPPSNTKGNKEATIARVLGVVLEGHESRFLELEDVALPTMSCLGN